MGDVNVLASASLINNFEQQQGIPHDALVNVMVMESGLKPYAQNGRSNATGLIQFMPKLLSTWGYTTQQVKNMSIIEQFPLIVKYFSPYLSKLKQTNDPFDWYCAVFWPVAIGKPDSYVISRGGKVVTQNPDYAINGIITKSSVRTVFNRYVQNFKNKNGLNDVKKKFSNNPFAAGFTQPGSAPNTHNFLDDIGGSIRNLFTNGWHF